MSMPTTVTLTILYFGPPTMAGSLLVDSGTKKRRVFTRDNMVVRDINRDLQANGVTDGPATIVHVTAIEKDGWLFFPDPDPEHSDSGTKLRAIPLEALASNHDDVARQLLVMRFNREELDIFSRWMRNHVQLRIAPRCRISCAILGWKDAAALHAFLETIGADIVREHFDSVSFVRIMGELKDAIERGEIADKEF